MHRALLAPQILNGPTSISAAVQRPATYDQGLAGQAGRFNPSPTRTSPVVGLVRNSISLTPSRSSLSDRIGRRLKLRQSAHVGHRRNINTDPIPPRRTTIHFIFNDRPPSERNYWLIVEPGSQVDLRLVDPGFDGDLYVSTDLQTMAEIWLGYTAIGRVSEDGRLVLTGNSKLAADLRTWLKLSVFAKVEKKVA